VEWRYGEEWSPSRPVHVIVGEEANGAPWIGGYVGLKASFAVVKSRKSLEPTGNGNPVVQLIANH
jgi:hypothetical protein